jgi:hypothetical protein
MASSSETVRTPRDREPILIAFLVALSLAIVTDALAAWSDAASRASGLMNQRRPACFIV